MRAHRPLVHSGYLAKLFPLAASSKLIPSPWGEKKRRTLKKLRKFVVALVALTAASLWFGAGAASGDYAEGAPPNSWDIDGEFVYDITRIDDRIYVGGDFNGVFSPQDVPTSQPYLVAFDVSTGDYIPTFTPSLNGLVESVEASSDGSVLYVGGNFTTANGDTRLGVVALDPITGATIPGFVADVNGGPDARTVNDIEVDGNDVYIGGDFFTVNSANIPRVARIDATTGAVDTTFDPRPNNTIVDMALTPDGNRLYLGGFFDALDGVSVTPLVAISLPSGTHDTSFVRPESQNVRAVEATNDRVIAADHKRNFIRVYDPTGFEIAELSGDGDFQDLELVGRRFIIGSHSRRLNSNTSVSRLQAAFVADGAVSDTLTTEVKAWPGVFSTYASGPELWVGGKFFKIGTTFRKELGRLGIEDGQTGPTQPLNLIVSAPAANQLELNWTASTDDLGVLGYRVLKGGTQVAFVTSGTSWLDLNVEVGVNHQYHVEAVDTDDNLSLRSNGVIAAATDGSDTVAPTVPTDLATSAVTASSVSLTWTDSFDLVGVDHYDIVRDGVVIGSTPDATAAFTDDDGGLGLSSSTTYVYEVKAVDAAGNESGLSTALPVATTDVTAPTVPTGVVVTGSTVDTVSLSWAASTDDVGVIGYEVLRDGVVVGSPTGTTFDDTGLTQSTSYSYTVRALDAAPNTSAESAPVVGTTPAPDTVDPNGTVSSPTNNEVLISTPVTLTGNTTDDVGIASADIALRNLTVGDPDHLGWLQTDLVTWGSYKRVPADLVTPGATDTDWSFTVNLPEGDYGFRLIAVDTSGNTDASGPWVKFSVNTTDTEDPSVPGVPTLTAATETSIEFTWAASTDNFGVDHYDILRDSVVVGSTADATASYTDTGLTAATAYSYEVVAVDAAGNESDPSPAASLSTTDGEAPTVPTGLAVTGTSTTSVSLAWTASTDNVAVVGYEVLRDAVVVGSPTGTTFDDTGLTEGVSYTYTVRALDAEPNTSAESAAVIGTTSVTDTTDPDGTVTSPTNNEILPSSPVTLTGNATDNVGVATVNVAVRNLNVGDPDYQSWLQDDLVTWGAYEQIPSTLVTPGATDTDWSFIVGLPDGDYAFQLVAKDAAGNTDPTRPFVKFSINTAGPDSERPFAFIDTPVANEQLTAGVPFSFTGTATDNIGVSTVEILIYNTVTGKYLRTDGSFGQYQRLATTEGSPGATSTTWTADYTLPAGNYWVKALSFDAAGNVNQTKPKVFFDMN